MMDKTENLDTREQVLSGVRKFDNAGGEYRWNGVELLQYKPTGTHFRDITRQVLFGDEHGLPTQLRYFEVAPGGHSTLERHEHVHAVLILRGRGKVLLGDHVEDVDTFDTVYVAPRTWHQFRANRGEALGFLCVVACDRDRPQRPDADDLELLRKNPDIRDFIRI